MTPLQMARFYSAIANGGKLVQPHVLLDVENPNKTLVPTAAPAAPRPIPGLDPAYLDVVQAGLFEGTHIPFGTSYGVFGHFPVPIAGKTGTAQKVVSLPGYTGEAEPVVVVRLRSVRRREARRLRRDRERRLRRGQPRRRRPSGSSRSSSTSSRANSDTTQDSEATDARIRGITESRTARERDAPHLLAVVRSFDWILARRASRRSSSSGSGASAASRSSTSRATRTTTSTGRSSTPRRRARRSWPRRSIDPDLYRRYWRAIFVGTVGRSSPRPRSSGTRRTARRAGSTSASSPSSRRSSGSSSSSLALAGLLAERQRDRGSGGRR